MDETNRWQLYRFMNMLAMTDGKTFDTPAITLYTKSLLQMVKLQDQMARIEQLRAVGAWR
jgi:hypothetical protein